jgi:hypothetical protein
MKTAVEWLLEELEMNILWTDKARKSVQQAKQMEKNQIIDAFYSYPITVMSAEEYYNETFNK